jgi:hypothetical protein
MVGGVLLMKFPSSFSEKQTPMQNTQTISYQLFELGFGFGFGILFFYFLLF